MRSLKIALQPFFVLLFDLCVVVGHDLHGLWSTPNQNAEKFCLNCSSSAQHRDEEYAAQQTGKRHN